jgi:hypothetical protein
MEAPEPPTAHSKKQNPADAGFCEPEWGGWSAPPGGSLGIVIRVNQVARDTQMGAILSSQSSATCCSRNSSAPTASLPPPCSTRSRDSTGCRRRWADCARRLRHRNFNDARLMVIDVGSLAVAEAARRPTAQVRSRPRTTAQRGLSTSVRAALGCEIPDRPRWPRWPEPAAAAPP